VTPPDPAPGGATTASAGTPFPVDLSRDRRARRSWAGFIGGPVIWITHFMFVYLVAEAGCTGDGPGLEVFDPPVPRTVTLAATAVAAAACVPLAAWALRRWRSIRREPAAGTDLLAGRTGDGGGGGGLAFAGFLLSSFSFVAILFVGLPAAFLPAC